MTWVRRHCLIRAWDHEDCDICGCHEVPDNHPREDDD